MEFLIEEIIESNESFSVFFQTLDDLLCSEVLVSNPVNRTQTVLNAAIDKSNDNHKKAFRVQRPGLGEIL